jgi:hypothetical protein
MVKKDDCTIVVDFYHSSAGVMHCEYSWPTHNTCVYVEAETEQGAQMRHTLYSFHPSPNSPHWALFTLKHRGG